MSKLQLEDISHVIALSRSPLSSSYPSGVMKVCYSKWLSKSLRHPPLRKNFRFRLRLCSLFHRCHCREYGCSRFLSAVCSVLVRYLPVTTVYSVFNVQLYTFLICKAVLNLSTLKYVPDLVYISLEI